MTGIERFNFVDRMEREAPELAKWYRDWTLEEVWAFHRCNEGHSDGSGPDEDSMRAWLARHEDEYPGDELAWRMFLRGDFSTTRFDLDTPAEVMSFNHEIGRMDP